MPERINFGKLEEVLEIPDLIGIQLESYRSFLQLDVPPEQRKKQGLQEVFHEIFPIAPLDKQVLLEFVSYRIGTPKKELLIALKMATRMKLPFMSLSV